MTDMRATFIQIWWKNEPLASRVNLAFFIWERWMFEKTQSSFNVNYNINCTAHSTQICLQFVGNLIAICGQFVRNLCAILCAMRKIANILCSDARQNSIVLIQTFTFFQWKTAKLTRFPSRSMLHIHCIAIQSR